MSKFFFERLTDTEQDDVKGALAPNRVCAAEGITPTKCGSPVSPNYDCSPDPLGTCTTPSGLTCPQPTSSYCTQPTTSGCDNPTDCGVTTVSCGD
jgi:hypothetical protein